MTKLELKKNSNNQVNERIRVLRDNVKDIVENISPHDIGSKVILLCCFTELAVMELMMIKMQKRFYSILLKL